MGFFLVFFPEEKSPIINKIKLSSSSSSPLSFIKPLNSSHLLSKAQSTISICALLVFITLLLFTLSTFEPSSSNFSLSSSNFSLSSRRKLSEIPLKSHKNGEFGFPNSVFFRPHALQRMGTLYRRGTNAMNNLIVAHIVESLSLHDLKLFLRVLHRSSLISRSDLLFIFPSKSSLSSIHSTILEENNSFLKIIEHYQSNPTSKNSTAKFNLTQFVKWSKMEKRSSEPIWGRRIRSNLSEQGNSTESTQLSYGSIVGFDVDELDPENSLAGFLEHVPMNLRRWACYPMLLGRIKRNFKHIMLVDVKEMLLIGDPSHSHRVKNQSPDSVYLFSSSTSAQSAFTRHPKKNSDKTRSKSMITPAIIFGGEKGVRRLSIAMLTEIVRKSEQKKKKNSVTEFGVFNQLVGNEFLLTNVRLVMQSESIPELSSLSESNLKQGNSEPAVFRRGSTSSNSEVSFTVLKILLCSSMLDSLFYSDC